MPAPLRTGGGHPAPGLVHSRPTAELWRRLARPFDSAEVSEALLGIPSRVIRELADAIISTGAEADALLKTLPALMRRLRMGSGNHVERGASGVRGPILWSETVAARSSSLGHDGVFVCSIPGRDYDVAENRALVAALRAVVASGERLTTSFGHDAGKDSVAAAARSNAELASRYLGHRALSQVGAGPGSRTRDRRSSISGRRAAGYEPAVALLEKLDEPFAPEELLPYCSRSTRLHHQLLVAAIEKLESGGRSLPALRTEADVMVVGPYVYVHPRGNRTGHPEVAVMHDDRLTIAFDPLGVGHESVPPGLIGDRRLVGVSNTEEVAELIGSSRG